MHLFVTATNKTLCVFFPNTKRKGLTAWKMTSDFDLSADRSCYYLLWIKDPVTKQDTFVTLIRSDRPAECLPGLFLGSKYSLTDQFLKKYQIKAILTVAADVKYSATDSSIDHRVKELWDSPDDFHQDQMFKCLEECVEFIRASLSAGNRVFVHCSEGVSRSVTVVCAYLMHPKSGFVTAMSCEEAFDRIRNLRPQAQPINFRNCLERWYNHCCQIRQNPGPKTPELSRTSSSTSQRPQEDRPHSSRAPPKGLHEAPSRVEAGSPLRDGVYYDKTPPRTSASSTPPRDTHAIRQHQSSSRTPPRDRNSPHHRSPPHDRQRSNQKESKHDLSGSQRTGPSPPHSNRGNRPSSQY